MAIDLLKKLNHRNIVKYLGCFGDNEYLNIVLEFVENGSLEHVLKKVRIIIVYFVISYLTIDIVFSFL